VPSVGSLPHTPARTGTTTPTDCLVDRHAQDADEALRRAVVATRLVHEHRQAMLTAAAERRRAVVLAYASGLTMRRVAMELGVSTGSVQRIVETARSRASRGVTP
jgi:DNA-directed RNA polymerase specialized sigma24 family protein